MGDFEYNKKWQQRNRDKCRAYGKKYRDANLEKSRLRERIFARENKEKRSATYKVWASENKGKRNAITTAYKLRKNNSIPVDVDLEVVEWYYIIAVQMSDRIGIPKFYHVDHIIPLSKGGLHHEDNLQILTAHQNLSKGAS